MIKRFTRLLGNLLLVCMVLLSLSAIYSIYQIKTNPSELPSIMGYKFMTVLTGSMEPKVKTGDLIIVKPIHAELLQVNDVITYRIGNGTLVTHRIIDLFTQDGEIIFQTKGDANNIEDEKLVQSEQIVGSMVFLLPKFGYLANFIKSPVGVITILALLVTTFLIGWNKRMSLTKNVSNQGLKG